MSKVPKMIFLSNLVTPCSVGEIRRGMRDIESAERSIMAKLRFRPFYDVLLINSLFAGCLKINFQIYSLFSGGFVTFSSV